MIVKRAVLIRQNAQFLPLLLNSELLHYTIAKYHKMNGRLVLPRSKSGAESIYCYFSHRQNRLPEDMISLICNTQDFMIQV